MVRRWSLLGLILSSTAFTSSVDAAPENRAAELSDVSPTSVRTAVTLLTLYSTVSNIADTLKSTRSFPVGFQLSRDIRTPSGRAAVLEYSLGEALTESDTVFVVFRGSVGSTTVETLRNVLTDMTTRLVSPKALKPSHGEMVHSGIWAEYLRFRPELHAALAEQYKKGKRQVIFFGHSLGGALATFAAVDASMALPLRPHLLTSGAPRVGNGAFRALAESRVPHAGRFVLERDPIPDLPAVPAYEHAGFFVLLQPEGIRLPNNVIQSDTRAHGTVVHDFGHHSFERYSAAAQSFFHGFCAKSQSPCRETAWDSARIERTARAHLAK